MYALIRGGYLAVTTFFVLSGFVLARSYAATAWNRGKLLRYGVGRFARVYPVYVLSLLVVAPFIAADRTPAKAPSGRRARSAAAGLAGRISGELEYAGVVALLRDVFLSRCSRWQRRLMRAPTGSDTLVAAAFACCLTRVLVGRRRSGRNQAAHPPFRFPDGDRGRARLRPAASRAARPRGRLAILPGFALAAALIALPSACRRRSTSTPRCGR